MMLYEDVINLRQTRIAKKARKKYVRSKVNKALWCYECKTKAVAHMKAFGKYWCTNCKTEVNDAREEPFYV